MDSAKLSIVHFNSEDVIATSFATKFKLSGIYDGIQNNAKATFDNGKSVNLFGDEEIAMNEFLNTLGLPLDGNYALYVNSGTDVFSFPSLITDENAGRSEIEWIYLPDMDYILGGYYYWDGEFFIRQ